MKFIEVEDDLYRYIASQTESIGESASAILRRLLGLPPVGEIKLESALNANVAKASTIMTANIVAENIVASKKMVASMIASPVVAAIKDQLSEVKQELTQESAVVSADFSDLVQHSQVQEQKASIGRFLMILSLLYGQQPQQFANVLKVSGRDRVYFAKDQQTLLASGASSKPKQIANTPYWVVTNSNNGMKCRILKKALLAMACPNDIADQIIEQI
ncbi:MAG: replication initiation negative regulator SeqA [Gammaproteobacteria bacterium]|nr:replication initiation negative regulator SeqA [Gammaproteobacteria bacterium]